MKILKISDKSAYKVLEALIGEKRRLNKVDVDLQEERRLIDENIFQLRGNTDPVEFMEYDPKWNWSSKIDYFAYSFQTAFNAVSFVDHILTKEPDLNKDQVYNSISGTLSTKVKDGKYSKWVPGKGRLFIYGPQEWFTEDDKLLRRYYPDNIEYINNDNEELDVLKD